jgi:hypothetical protein
LERSARRCARRVAPTLRDPQDLISLSQRRRRRRAEHHPPQPTPRQDHRSLQSTAAHHTPHLCASSQTTSQRRYMALEPPDSQTPPPEIKRPIRSANHPLHSLTPQGALPARPSRRTMRRSAKDTRRWREGLNKHDIHQNPARADPGSRARVTLTDHPIPLPARGDPPPRRAHGRLRGIGRVGLGVDEQTNATREPDAFETHCSAKCSGARRQADRGAYAGVWITAAAARPTTRRLIRAHPTIGRGPLLAAIQNVA